MCGMYTYSELWGRREGEEASTRKATQKKHKAMPLQTPLEYAPPPNTHDKTAALAWFNFA